MTQSKNRAFTLIELLVVIAIIAILAAILFPVFAQAKTAAKKTASLSQAKQIGTAIHVYLSDSDDTFPLAFGLYQGDPDWAYTYGHEVPADWNPAYGSKYVAMNNASWANSTLPYSKNIDILSAPGVPDRNLFDETFPTVGVKRYAKVNYSYNGLLHGYPAGSVNAPSQLPLLTQANGNMNILAYAYSNPYLVCNFSSQPCRYVPSTPACDAETSGGNGQWSGLFNPDASMWVHGNGMNVVFSDSSAKFRRTGANVNGRTDYRSDFYSAYDSTGTPKGQWQDKNFCHALLFQPDFDFSDYGNPVEWK